MPYLGNNLGVAFSSYKLIDSLTASFNGTTTSFALTVNGVTPVPFPLNEQNILISVGGVPQKPDSTGTEGFRFSGSNIVFSSAPKTGEAFWGVVLAGADRVNAGVQYPDGTASVPSISFASQTTTGFYRSGSGQIGVGINGSTPVAFSTSGVQLNGSTSGSVIIASPAVAGNNTLTLPTSNGSANQFLKNGATAGSLGYSSTVEDSSGRLLVGTSSANANGGILQLSSGITFPATAVAASDANTLDDYEEGTWTPVVSFGGASVGITGTFSGTYTKVGNVVTVCYIVSFTSKGTSTGSMKVAGLPFTAGNVNNTISGFGYVHRLAALQTAGQMYFALDGTDINPKFVGYNSGNTTALTNTDIIDSTDLRGGIVFRV